jgi:hypothetical protein
MEMTESADCREGLEPSIYYDFYANVAPGDSTESPMPRPDDEYETTLI